MIQYFKVHFYTAKRQDSINQTWHKTLCGREIIVVDCVTKDIKHVTCKVCKRKLSQGELGSES